MIKVAVIRVGDGRFSYFNHIEDLAVGDMVVVPFGETFRLGTVLAEAGEGRETDKAAKWVVQKCMDRETMDKWDALTALRPPPETKKYEVRWYQNPTILKQYMDSKRPKKRPV